jgi:hypothetical protein
MDRQGAELPHHKPSRNGFVASFKNLVERARTKALEKGAKDEVDNGREESVGAGGIGKISSQ